MNKKTIILTAFIMTSLIACGVKPLSPEMEKKLKEMSDNEYKIFLLNDVTREGNTDILISPDPDTLKKYIPNGTYTSVVNAFLVQRNDSNFLFDAGLGIKLLDNLAAHGVAPEKIHKIFITHCHGDHIGGLLKDEKAVFPNAEIYINKVEYDYWLKEQNPLFLSVIEKYNQLQLFEFEYNYKEAYIESITMRLDDMADITAINAYGHTSGHTMYLIGKPKNQTLIWGDLTHVMPIQMPHPEYSVSYDVYPQEAAKIRQNILAYIANSNIRVAGMHVASMGTVSRNGASGYIFNPIKN
jgi:glyoxylase-like metal-dependent hydrolase (beta-lactamase superfamily II)